MKQKAAKGTAAEPMQYRNADPAGGHGQSLQRRDLTVRSFQLRADTIDEAARSVQAVIATEAPTLVLDMRRWEVVEEVLLASGMDVASPDGQVPLLDTHDRSTTEKQLGSCRNVHAEGDKIVGTNVFSSVVEADKCWTKVKEGHVRDNSVGYQVLEYVTIEAGTTATVEGRTFTAADDRPLRVTTRWIIKENSVCPIGADPGAKMRGETAPEGISESNQTNANKPYRRANMKLRQYLIGLGMSESLTDDEMRSFWNGLTDTQRAEAPEQLAAPQPQTNRSEPVQVPGMTDAQRAAIREAAQAEYRAQLQAERERCATIRTEGNAAGVPADVIERCCADGSDVATARAEFLKAIQANRANAPAGGLNVMVPGSSFGLTERHLSASMLLRAGNVDDANLKKFYGDDVVNQAMDKVRRISLLDLTRMALALKGREAPLDRDELIRAGFSTGTLPIILGDVANKSMMVGFKSAMSTWRSIATVHSVSDFKNTNLLRLNANGRLEKVSNGGEVKYAERSETRGIVAADTYAKNFSVTRTDLINDDAGAFTTLPMKLGKKADSAIADLVYTVLLANVLADGNSTALFSTTAHTDFDGNAIVNLQTSSALAIAKIKSAVALFRKFREYNGDPIDVAPGILLCPPELEGTANNLIYSEKVVGTEVGELNPNRKWGMDVVAESRLSNTRFTGNSATSWYLLPRAGETDFMSVAFLNGVETPTLTTYDVGPDRLGATWQILHDFGAAATEFYGVLSQA